MNFASVGNKVMNRENIAIGFNVVIKGNRFERLETAINPHHIEQLLFLDIFIIFYFWKKVKS